MPADDITPCRCLIAHARTKEERKQAAERLRYFRSIGDSRGIMLAVAQLSRCPQANQCDTLMACEGGVMARKGRKGRKGPKRGTKGVAGKGTGGAARKAIRAAKKRGCTNKDIGRAARRSPSVIGAISTGVIKNPPEGLAGRIAKSKCSK